MISSEGAAPLYVRVAADLWARIESGELKAGDALPAEADLAVTYDVSRDTIREALSLLRLQGLIESKRGYRSIVRQLPPREVITGQPGDRIYARRASAEERSLYGLQLGEYVLVIGDRVVCPADRCIVEIQAGDGSGDPEP